MSCRIFYIFQCETINLFTVNAFVICIAKSAHTDAGNACRDRNILKRITLLECKILNFDNTIRDLYTRQCFTATECQPSYSCHSVRYGYVGKSSIIPKCLFAYLRYFLAVDLGRNDVCFVYSVILAYFYCSVIKLCSDKTSFIGKSVPNRVHMSPCILDVVYLEAVNLLCFHTISVIVIS